MAKQQFLVAVLMALIAHAASLAATTSGNSTTAEEIGTAYDVLDQDNLPRGLLPQGVLSYVVHVGGVMEVTLPGECSFVITADGKQYKFRYARRVGGQLLNSKITSVFGVAMQLASTWFDVSEMDNIGGDFVKMQLETSTQYIPVPAFIQSPRCN